MFCENCGKRLEEGSKFCNGCGARQPQPVFCIRCGKKLEPRSLFCNGCGASQTPKAPEPEVILPQEPEVTAPGKLQLPEEPVIVAPEAPAQAELPQEPIPAKKKKSKKWLIPAIALVLVVAVAAAVLIPMLFGKVTVYVTTEYGTGGILGQGKVLIDYDEKGRPVTFQSVDTDGNVKVTSTVSYDKYGNRTRVRTETSSGTVRVDDYDFSYGKRGQIEECQISWTYNGKKREQYTCEFTYDKKGNVVLVEYEGYNVGHRIWDYYEYDKQGRLVQETFCAEHGSADPSEVISSTGIGFATSGNYSYRRYTYIYDENGYPEEVGFSVSHSSVEQDPEELDELDFQQKNCLDLRYDSDGRLMRQDGERLQYDKNGNLEAPENYTYTYDEYGNLICKEFEPVRPQQKATRAEYAYEPLKLSKKDAARAERLKIAPDAVIDFGLLHYLDPQYTEKCPNVYVQSQTYTIFYYYLIPNPVW